MKLKIYKITCILKKEMMDYGKGKIKRWEEKKEREQKAHSKKEALLLTGAWIESFVETNYIVEIKKIKIEVIKK